MLKGTLEGCVLAVLRADECYGYEISQRLEKLRLLGEYEGTSTRFAPLEKTGGHYRQLSGPAEGPQREVLYPDRPGPGGE